MKPAQKSVTGTSFHGSSFNASVSDLREILGAPRWQMNDGMDKINFQWDMVTEKDEVFTVYDYKEYVVLDEDELIEWHVGGNSAIVTIDAVNEISDALNYLHDNDFDPAGGRGLHSHV